MEDRFYDVTFEYIGGSKEALRLRYDHYDDLKNHLIKKGFTGIFEEEESGNIYNLSLIKMIY